MIPLGVLASTRVAAAGGGGLTYEGSVLLSYATTDTITFPSAPFGTAGASRTIIAAVSRRLATGSLITGVTIGGVTATLAEKSGTPNYDAASIWYATVPTGATGDVVATLSKSETNQGAAVFLYRADAAVSVAASNATYLASGGETTVSVSPASAGTHLVAVAASSRQIAGSWAWTGATEDGDLSYPAAVPFMGSAASLGNLPSGATSVTATPSSTGANSFQGCAVCAFTTS